MAAAPKTLPQGRYLLRCKQRTFLAAASNGHSAVWPQAEAVSDGKHVRFFREGKVVFECNPVYAAHNFDVAASAK